MSAAAPTVHLDVADGIATIRIDNPSKRNCLGPAMWDRLYDIATDAAGDPAVRVAVIRGVGDKAFSAGCFKVMLLSGSANKDAHRFYENLGFTTSKTGFELRAPGYPARN